MRGNVPEPLTCEDVRDSLAAYAAGRLPVERRGRVAGHIDSCHGCASALAQTVAEGMAAGTMPARALARRGSAALGRRIGKLILWGGRGLEHSLLHACGYQAALVAAISGGIALGGSDADQDSVRFQLLGPGMEPASGERVCAAVTSPPMVDREGGFTMAVWLEEHDAERFRGYAAVCTLKLDGLWLGFESRIEGREVEFRAEGLPPLPDGEYLLLRPDSLDYYLASSIDAEAA